jgi:hypothetical protein
MKKLIVSILVLFASSAHAQEVDVKYFKDWLTLAELLSSKGIAPHTPSWAVIEPICLPLKKGSDEIDYNRCKYEYAVSEVQWHNDNRYCKEKADQQYDDYVRYEQQVTSAVIIDKDGNKSTVRADTKNINPYPRSYKNRDISYRDCMMSMNWNNPELWRSGKRQTPTETIINNTTINNTTINN